MRDTSAEALRVQTAVLRRLDGCTHLRQAMEWSDTARALALLRLQTQHPGLSRRALILQLLRDTYPECDLPSASV